MMRRPRIASLLRSQLTQGATIASNVLRDSILQAVHV